MTNEQKIIELMDKLDIKQYSIRTIIAQDIRQDGKNVLSPELMMAVGECDQMLYWKEYTWGEKWRDLKKFIKLVGADFELEAIGAE